MHQRELVPGAGSDERCRRADADDAAEITGLDATTLGNWARTAQGVPESSAPLAEQPVVFIGSEGDDNRPVAENLPDFLALLAAGVGPREATFPPDDARPLPTVRAVLDEHFPNFSARTPKQIIEDASARYGDFEARVEELYHDQRMAELDEYGD